MGDEKIAGRIQPGGPHARVTATGQGLTFTVRRPSPTPAREPLPFVPRPEPDEPPDR